MLKESVNALPKVVGFLRELRFPPTGKVDRAHAWVRINIVRKVISLIVVKINSLAPVSTIN